MARKEITVTISQDGRDKGKQFFIREWPASVAEKWGIRALLALTKSGVTIPDDIANAGIAGVAALGIQAFAGLDALIAIELMDEMFQCVQVMPDPSNPNVMRKLVEDDIEEVRTRLFLRAEVFMLHTGFSMADFKSKLKSADSSVGLKNTETSPGQSGQ